jgi:hypothetical protein
LELHWSTSGKRPQRPHQVALSIHRRSHIASQFENAKRLGSTARYLSNQLAVARILTAYSDNRLSYFPAPYRAYSGP